MPSQSTHGQGCEPQLRRSTACPHKVGCAQHLCHHWCAMPKLPKGNTEGNSSPCLLDPLKQFWVKAGCQPYPPHHQRGRCKSICGPGRLLITPLTPSSVAGGLNFALVGRRRRYLGVSITPEPPAGLAVLAFVLRGVCARLQTQAARPRWPSDGGGSGGGGLACLPATAA